MCGPVIPPILVAKEQVYGVLAKRQKYQAHRRYIELGVDEELVAFYSKGNQAAVLGDKKFRQQALKKNETGVEYHHKKKVLIRPTAKQVTKATTKVFSVPEAGIITAQKGRRSTIFRERLRCIYVNRLVTCDCKSLRKLSRIEHKRGVSNALMEIRRLLSEKEEFRQNIQRILTMIQ